MMLETWKGLGGNTDPLSTTVFENAINGYSTHFTLSPATSGPAAPLANVLKCYRVQDLANGVYYFATLSYKPAVTGSSPEPEAINVSISWNQGYGTSGTSMHTISMSTYTN
jgi:hypothetical protein